MEAMRGVVTVIAPLTKAQDRQYKTWGIIKY